ncbi:hypothetical protein XENOCAPTIV_012379, partial [Xenoophorus captivus]
LQRSGSQGETKSPQIPMAPTIVYQLPPPIQWESYTYGPRGRARGGLLEIGPEEGLDGEGLVPPPAWSVGKWIIGPATAHSAMGHAQKELLCLCINPQDSRGLFLHNLQMQHSYLHKAVNIVCRDGDSSDTPHREWENGRTHCSSGN